MTSRLLFLTKYDEAGASSRYRVYQYLRFLEAAGIEYSVCPLLPVEHVRRRYGQGTGRPQHRLTTSLLRSLYERVRDMATAVRSYDLVFVQYEALPYVPYEVERLLLRTDRPMVTDYDDATFVTYATHRNPVVRTLLRSKIASVVRASAHVIVGNRHLADWASQYSESVSIIPTSVDLTKYPSTEAITGQDSETLVWIGTPVTARYLRLIRDPLRSLRARHDFVLKVIGAPLARMQGVDIVHVPWSATTEGQELSRCAAGLMPLNDGLWERGKSALKLIQYMAAGIVGVASPVGANRDVIQDGVNGFLAASDEEWVGKLSLTLSDPSLRLRLGRAGRETVRTRYSLQVNARRWVELLLSLCR